MKSYLSLVPISARVHKRQSRMTRICIILAVFLVTALFSMAEMWIGSEKDAMIAKHGNYHIILQNIAEDMAKQIAQRSDVEISSWYEEINAETKQGYYINGKNAVVYGSDPAYTADIRNYPAEGTYPKNDKEAALSTDAKELLGVGVGDNITLNTPAGDFHYTISGFYEDDTEFNKSMEGSCVYVNRTAFDKICSLNEEESMPQYYIRFKEDANLKKTIADIEQQYNLTSENVDENIAVLGLSGASSNESAKNVYPLVGVCFLLILISGVLMISGCINSNVAQRTNFFGMMRCIGASKQQIIRYVRLEALNWCITAIPAGCLLGVITNWILCAVLRLLVKGEWAYMPLFGVSVLGIICGVAMGIITVFIAANSPAKRAAKVSPVSAISGNTGAEKSVSHVANTRFFKIETILGIHHAVGTKKNLILISGSFALTIVLFLFFSACLDIVHCLLPSLSNFSPDITISSQEETNSIDENLVTEISKLPGVEHTFGIMYAIKTPAKINGIEQTIDLMSYEEFMFENTKNSVVSGDLSQVYGNSDYALTVFSQDSHLDVGDKVEIGDNELEIACVESEGIGSVSGSATVVCSEETFTRLTGDEDYLMVNVILKKDATEATVNQIRSLAGDLSFIDNRANDSEIKGSYWVFRLAAYGFLAIISLITVLNIMNSISMSVSARTKQYGAMRAVGMENRQITKMITAEAVTYAVCGMIVGDIFGLLLHHLLYEKVILTHFGGNWKVPFVPLGIILLLVLISCAAAVYAPAKRMRNLAITDTINDL